VPNHSFQATPGERPSVCSWLLSPAWLRSTFALRSPMTTEDKGFLELLFAITAACFGIGLWIRRREAISRSWPQSRGTIVSSKTVREYVQPGQYQVSPVIEYEFKHKGQIFRSSHRRFGNYSVGRRVGAETVTSRYPVGASVTVYVNQKHPTKSVLEVGHSTLSWVPFGFGILFLVVSALVVAALLRR